MARMSKFTLLDDAVRGFGGAAAVGWVGETDWQRQIAGLHDTGGEGPAEAAAGAKQDLRAMPELITVRPVLQALAITRRVPKCAPDMYVWSTADLRLIYA